MSLMIDDGCRTVLLWNQKKKKTCRWFLFRMPTCYGSCCMSDVVYGCRTVLLWNQKKKTLPLVPVSDASVLN
jgi:hypothetical protein